MEEYGGEVRYRVGVPAPVAPDFALRVADVTAGEGRTTPAEPKSS
jgi:hypothetical protein